MIKLKYRNKILHEKEGYMKTLLSPVCLIATFFLWLCPSVFAESTDVLIVGNAQDGTVSFIDTETLTNIGTVDTYPDRTRMKFLIHANPVRAIAYQVVKRKQLLHHFEPGGGDRFVDDVFLSPDGRTLYVSRSNLGDVAAFDLSKEDHPIIWRRFVAGFKADHAAISPDGKRLVVSATSANKAQIFDAKTGKVIKSFKTGTYPHQNDYSHDGKYIYNSSIGDVGYKSVPYEKNKKKGRKLLVKVNADDGAIVDTWEFEYGIRPNIITPDDKTLYTQLSYLNGVVKYDLENKKEISRNVQPLSDFALTTYKNKNEYPHDSAHHGLALSGDGKTLCDCGTIGNTVAMIDAETMETKTMVDVGLVPYWASTGHKGKLCFVSMSGDDEVAVLDYEHGQVLANIPVGHFPQRSRLGRIPQDVREHLSHGR